MSLAIKRPEAFVFGRLLWCVVALIGTGGCAEESTQYEKTEAVVAPATPAETARDASGSMSAPGQPAAEPPPALPRKVIYNAQVTLVVESLTNVGEKIRQLVEASGGYISETDTNMQTRSRRVGMWKVRVPVARFDAFMASVAKLGEPQQIHIDSQDVSQEYYDIEARISNKQQEEKRLLKHLADSTGKLEDILAVERELSRVRGEIEQMQGRIRYLTNQTDLSTVTITVSEVKGYTPPVSPTLATELDRTFRRSIEQLGLFGRGVLLFVVAVAPWIVAVVLISAPIWWVARRLRRRL